MGKRRRTTLFLVAILAMALLATCESAGARTRVDRCATFACSTGLGCNVTAGADAVACYNLVCRHSAGDSGLGGC